MKLMPSEDFWKDFGNAARQTMNLSIYRDGFECSCGKKHWFDESIDVICQGWGQKLVVICPDDSAYLTSLKIKTFMVFKFKGFESLAGTHLTSQADKVCLQVLRQAILR